LSLEAVQLGCSSSCGPAVPTETFTLVGGPQTIRAFQALGALDRLEILVLPTLFGKGVPLSPPESPQVSLQLLGPQRTFPYGTIELVYAPR
jgi:dihydrofolate reductase